MGKYHYLLWDIDGTVLNFKAAEKVAIKSLFRKFDFPECTDEMVAKYSEINTKYWALLEQKKIEKPLMLVERFREFFSMVHVDIKHAEEFNREYQMALGDTIVFHDDAFSYLQKLKKEYVLVAITNGTSVAQHKKLSRSGLDKVFDYIFISDEVGFEKPSPEYFRVVIEKTGIKDLREALVIGDSLSSDILGGNRMHIDTCFYNPPKKPISGDILPKYEIAKLQELDKILL